MRDYSLLPMNSVPVSYRTWCKRQTPICRHILTFICISLIVSKFKCPFLYLCISWFCEWCILHFWLLSFIKCSIVSEFLWCGWMKPRILALCKKKMINIYSMNAACQYHVQWSRAEWGPRKSPSATVKLKTRDARHSATLRHRHAISSENT